MTAPVVGVLRDTVAGRIITDPAIMQAYQSDQCVAVAPGLPAAVVRAESPNDVVETLKIASAHGVPVVTRGRGTGLAGGAAALAGSIVLSLDLLDEIVEIDPVARTATVQCGVINGDLDRAARAQGLYYAPDPGSRDICSIGGNIATNAGGMCCVKHGVTRDNVLSLTAVLASGEVIRTGSTTRKNVAGLDLTSLLIGSEGTLAVVVEATVRLLPVPIGVSTIAATFATAHEAVQAVLALVGATSPSAVEIMDATTVRAINALTRMGLDETAGATLLVQFEGVHAGDEAVIGANLARTYGATDVLMTDDVEEGKAFMEARRMAYPALEALGTTLLDDVCVPVPRLPELLAEVERVGDQYGVVIGTFGHAGDGNLHPTIVFDPADQAMVERAHQAFDQIMRAAIAMGGTISGEHGVGALKTPWLTEQIGTTERQLMHSIKQAVDPAGILNPGRGY